MTSITFDLPVCQGNGDLLDDERTNWGSLKSQSKRISRSVSIPGGDYYERLSDRIESCANWLKFVSDVKGNRRLIDARFCCARICPACQRRRSLKLFHQVKRICSVIQSDLPTNRYFLLTLTIPNVKYDELRSAITHLNKSFRGLFLRKEVKKATRGFFRAMEITYNFKRDDYHPHFHILVAVSSGYFKKKYISRNRWLELWQQATRQPEITQVDVRCIRPNPARPDSDDISAAAGEVAKYATKPSDYLSKLPDGSYDANDRVVIELVKSLKHRRLVGFGGVFRDVQQRLDLEDVESDNADLVNVGEGQELIEAVMVEIYRWNIGLNSYVS